MNENPFAPTDNVSPIPPSPVTPQPQPTMTPQQAQPVTPVQQTAQPAMAAMQPDLAAAQQSQYTTSAMQQELAAAPTPQPQSAPKSRKLALILAGIAFTLTSLAFLVLGPGILIAALLTQPFSWIVSFYYMYVVVGAAAVSIVAALLYFAAIISASRNATRHLTNIIIMCLSSIAGFATMWLAGYNIIRISTTIAAILMSAYVVLPCAALILLHRYRKNRPGINVLYHTKKTTVMVAIVILALVAEMAMAGYYLFNLWQTYAPLIEVQNQYQAEQQEQASVAKGDKEISDRLAIMAFALCGGEYDIVHQIKGDSERAIFQCQQDKGIYEIYNSDEQTGYYKAGQAAYYGANYDEELEKYFPEQIYLYKNLLISSSPESIILLLEADSLEQVIDENLDAIYDYLQEATQKYKRSFTLDILYNENLDDVKSLEDYIVLAGALRDVDVSWLPHGNGFQTADGDYIVFGGPDDLDALMDLAHNPGSYSDQVRDAIKFRKHLSFEVEDTTSLTKEQLRELMLNSVVCEGPDGDWADCSLEEELAGDLEKDPE